MSKKHYYGTVAILLLWSIFWFLGRMIHSQVLKRHAWEQTVANSTFTEKALRVPWYVRLFFGFTPREGDIIVRPAIMQALALLMAAIEMGMQRWLGRGSGLGVTHLILLLTYFLLLIVIGYLRKRVK